MSFYELYCGNKKDLFKGSNCDNPSKLKFEDALVALDDAVEKREKSSTKNNSTSSRSHAVIKIVIYLN